MRELPRQAWTYIIASPGGTLYTGVTSNLFVRIRQHKLKTFKGFSSRYNCNRLVFFQEFDDIGSAITREKEIKGWTRVRKLTLIEESNPEWKDLAADWLEK